MGGFPTAHGFARFAAATDFVRIQLLRASPALSAAVVQSSCSFAVSRTLTTWLRGSSDLGRPRVVMGLIYHLRVGVDRG